MAEQLEVVPRLAFKRPPVGSVPAQELQAGIDPRWQAALQRGAPIRIARHLQQSWIDNKRRWKRHNRRREERVRPHSLGSIAGQREVAAIVINADAGAELGLTSLAHQHRSGNAR